MTRTERVERILVAETTTIEEVAKVLNKTGLRTVLVTDQSDRLSGVITDGDLRRALLAGVGLSDPASNAANRSFVALPADSSPDVVQEHLSDRIMLLPLVDENGRPVDFATKQALGFIPAAEPVLGEQELAYVTDCVRSGWISSQGSYVTSFEKRFADYIEAPGAITVSNGTVALHLALKSLGIGPGDEVIVPDLTFAASINAIFHAGATPVIVDVLMDELTIDVEAAARVVSPATRAIMPVHLYGQMCRMDEVLEFAAKHDLYVIEDAAEALGSRWGQKHAGTLGDAGTFSFFGNKLITTGEGGMVVFKDPEIAARARMLRDHGMDPKRRYWHLDVGFNYRMTNMQAAVGVAQLERIQELLEAKQRLAASYSAKLGDLTDRLRLPAPVLNTDHCFWCYVVVIEGLNAKRDKVELIDFMRKREIDVRPVFYPLHTMPPYHSVKRSDDCPTAVSAADRGIVLPSSPKLTERQAEHICETLRAGLDAIGVETLLRQSIQ